MMQLVVVAIGAIGLIVFVSFIAARLVRARTAGMSIRMQVFLALALIVGAFAFGLGLMVLDRVKARADLLGQEAALGEARAIAAVVGAEMESGETTLQEMGELLKRAAAAGDLHLTLIDDTGATVYTSGRAPDARGSVAASVPIVVGDKRVGQARVLKPTLVIQQTLGDFAPAVLIISLLLGAVAAGAAALIGRTIGEPIEQLTRFAERVSQGDRRAPPPPGHGREVMRLSRALDSMRRQLEGRPFVETFAADLSHELKNPVAAIRASGEVLRDGALEEPEQAARFVARILEATSRIEALLGDLLSLAKLEARGIEGAKTVELRERAESALEAARQGGAEVSLEVQGSTLVRGDGAWLTRAISNLIDNAVIHGTPGGPIVVSITHRGGELCCAVTNPGQISHGVQRRIFRRFVTTREDRGGTGLGLSIVRAIAEAHGGQVECTEEGPPEVRFELRLPAA